VGRNRNSEIQFWKRPEWGGSRNNYSEIQLWKRPEWGGNRNSVLYQSLVIHIYSVHIFAFLVILGGEYVRVWSTELD